MAGIRRLVTEFPARYSTRESDDRGILGLDDAIPGSALSTPNVVSIESPNLDPAARRELVACAVPHCPVSESISRAVPLEIEVG